MNIETTKKYNNILFKEINEIKIESIENKLYYTEADIADIYNKLYSLYGNIININIVSNNKIIGKFVPDDNFIITNIK